MNNITIIGRIGRDPELRFTTSQMAVANFSVATTRKKGDEEETTWFDCVSFGEQAENYVSSFVKGSRVIVVGRIEIKEYTKKDGTEAKKTQIIIDEAGLSARWKRLSSEEPSKDKSAPRRITDAFPDAMEEPF